jgi:hypothetical protein
MPALLTLAGVLAIVAGIAAIAFPFVDRLPRPFDIVVLMMAAGGLVAVGGFALIGLGAVVARLQRIRDAIEMQVFSHAPTPSAEVRPKSGAPEPSVVPAPSAGIAAVEAALAGSGPEKPAAAPPVPSPAAPDALHGPAAQPPANAAAEWPHVTAADRMVLPDGNGQAPVGPLNATAAGGSSVPPVAAQDGSPSPVRVLKSGVIEGMAYTLYSDGSVDAELPEGTRRFASISEWRTHLRVGG